MAAHPAKMDFGKPIEDLPVLTWDFYRDWARSRNLKVAFNGGVYDALAYRPQLVGRRRYC